jgi:hypothetical protein
MYRMKFKLMIVISLLSVALYSQNCIEFTTGGLDYLEINSKWMKAKKFKKIIEREYLKSNLDRVHLVNTLMYNDSGYIVKKINGIPYPYNDSPIEEDYTSVMAYEYELMDSFLYKKMTVLRNFNGKERLSKQDTLPPMYMLSYNIYFRKFMTYKGDKICEYTYDSHGNLLNIKGISQNCDDTNLKYKKDKLIQVEVNVKAKGEINPAFVQDIRIEYKYNSEGFINESNNINQNVTHKYFYDTECSMIRKELHIVGQLRGVYTYEYIR